MTQPNSPSELRSWLQSWRAAVRIARRESTRATLRTALVTTLIGLPVLALAFVAVTTSMFTLTPTEQADQLMGRADARLEWRFNAAVFQQLDGSNAWPQAKSTASLNRDTPSSAELLAVLPNGSRVLALESGTISVHTPAGQTDLSIRSIDATDPLATGYVKVLAGRAPRDGTEVALTKEAMRHTGTSIGATLSSADGTKSYPVVGEAEFASSLSELALFGPMAGPEINRHEWLVDTPGPIDASAVRALNLKGIAAASRELLINPPPGRALYPDQTMQPAAGPDQQTIQFVLLGGLAVLEVILLAGPAFTIAARRRQRQLALVAVAGATPAQVRRVVLADGAVLSTFGAAVGVALGIIGAVLARPILEEQLVHARAGGYRLFPATLLSITALAVLTGLAAAILPAFSAVRQPILAALAGRRAQTRSRRRWLLLGVALTTSGAAVAWTAAGARVTQNQFETTNDPTNLLLAGMILGEVGLALCTPALVGLISRAARVLPLTARMALRDAGRNRSAAAPAISAIMAAVAASVAIGLIIDSRNVASENNQPAAIAAPGYVRVSLPDPPPPGQQPAGRGPVTRAEIEERLRPILPITATAQLDSIDCTKAAQSCWLGVLTPHDQVCPWLQDGMIDRPTGDAARAARKDPRCAPAHIRTAIEYNGFALPDLNDLATLTGGAPDDVAAAQRVLQAGGVVVFDPALVEDGSVAIAYNTTQDGVPLSQPSVLPTEASAKVRLPAYAMTTAFQKSGWTVSPAALAKAGLTTRPFALIAATSRTPTAEERDRMQAVLSSLNSYGEVLAVSTSRYDGWLWIIAVASALTSLGAIAISTSLAAAEGRAELSTLAAVGASPGLRRRLSLSQTGVIAWLGALLGAAAGLGAAAVIVTAMNTAIAETWPGPADLPIVLPWPSLLASLVAVPLIALLGAGLFTRARLPIERRQ